MSEFKVGDVVGYLDRDGFDETGVVFETDEDWLQAVNCDDQKNAEMKRLDRLIQILKSKQQANDE